MSIWKLTTWKFVKCKFGHMTLGNLETVTLGHWEIGKLGAWDQGDWDVGTLGHWDIPTLE